jgi:hypothetical protein
MIRLASASILICMIFVGSDVRGDDETRPSKKKSSRAHSEAKGVGNKITHAFKSVGGHLQKFFTGHDTISR